jgi:hypothetical protein
LLSANYEYTAKRLRIPIIGIIETTLHLLPVSVGSVVSCPLQTCSDLTTPSLIAVQPVATCDAEFFMLRSKRKVTGPRRKIFSFIASDTWFYYLALRSTCEESAGCDVFGQNGRVS